MGYNLIEKRSDDVTNTKFVKLWAGISTENKPGEKCSAIAKNQPARALGRRYKRYVGDDSIQILLK